MRHIARAGLAACCIALLPQGAAAADEAAARQRLQAMGVAVGPERLVQFAAQGDVKMIELLLQAGVPPGAAEPVRQVTALHNAAAGGHKALVTLLVERGASVDAADWYGNTPLIVAAYHGQAESVKLLLRQGAAVDAAGRDGCTALAAAAYSGKLAVVQALLAGGATASTPCASGDTPLSIARRARATALAAELERHAVR
jgi:ankyrin repeat protein